MYIFNNEMITAGFTKFGYPTYIIYPLAALKILGVISLWVRKFPTLTNLAYAGFFYDFVLAFFAHFMISDGEQYGAVLAMILVISSYVSKGYYIDNKCN
jgi:hypothetical protein